MKAIRLDRLGPAAEVTACVEVSEPGAPGPGEILVRMLRMPINPSDLLIASGRYGATPPILPLEMGREGVGVVEAVGSGVTARKIGDLVIPLVPPTWRTLVKAKATGVIPLPAGVEIAQAAMLKVNPATAQLMLREVVALSAGDWVIQNAANSAVGIYLAKLAAHAGIRSLNIVRRPDAAAPLAGIAGAHAVLHEGGPSPELTAQIAAATAGAPVKLAIDAIGGAATEALAGAICEGGTVVNYGLLSGRRCEIDPKHLVFRNVTLRGFWVSKWLERATPDRIATLYAELADRLTDGTLRVAIAGVYPFSRIGEAMAHAAREARGGKVLLSGE
jgi:NADPH:quinone reductase-like Zn-dependent oxidoreductase